MKGDTRSPISTLASVSILMFAQSFFQINLSERKLNDDQLLDKWTQTQLVFKGTLAFLLGSLGSLVSPKQQRNFKQVCAPARVGKSLSGAQVCVRVYVRATMLWKFPLSTSVSTLSGSFDMLNLQILFFFLLWWGSVLFKDLSFPPDCLNPTSVWIVFLFQTKDRGGITISLPFALRLSCGTSWGIFKNHCLAAFAFCF